MMVALPKQHNILDFPEPVEIQGRSNEWYTPAKYIEAARAVMETIDLDPASCALANETVGAARYYTKEDDGLSKEWAGHVWLNPPFTTLDRDKKGWIKSCIGLFCTKLIREYEAGNVTEAIFLAMPNTDTRWFQPLWAFPICFTNHRLKFGGPKRFKSKSNSYNYGTCLAYLGPNESAFIEHFSPFGRIARAIDTPKPSPVNLTLWNGGDV